MFLDDSGALALGAAHGALAAAGGAGIAAAIAALPAAFSSFLCLAGAGRIAGHRRLEGGSGADMLPDWRLAPPPLPNAPLSLVRLPVSDGPLAEGRACSAMLRLVAFSGCLAAATAAADAVPAPWEHRPAGRARCAGEGGVGMAPAHAAPAHAPPPGSGPLPARRPAWAGDVGTAPPFSSTRARQGARRHWAAPAPAREAAPPLLRLCRWISWAQLAYL